MRRTLIALCACAAVLALTPAALAQSFTDGEQISAYFTGGSSDSWGSFGAGFYSETWNGQAVQVVTDDYADNVNGGQTWSANVYQVSNLTAANIGETLFGSTIGMQGYAEVAALVSEMYTIGLGGSTGTLGGQTVSRADLSAAIWYITGGPAWNSLSGAQQALVTYVQGLYGAADGISATAFLNTLKNLWISVPLSYQNGVLVPYENGEEDWLDVQVPEGGSALLFLLLAGAACFGALAFGSRNEIGSGEAA